MKPACHACLKADERQHLEWARSYAAKGDHINAQREWERVTALVRLQNVAPYQRCAYHRSLLERSQREKETRQTQASAVRRRWMEPQPRRSRQRFIRGGGLVDA